VEDHSTRLDKVENRISKLEDKLEIKGKTEELLVKQLKTCKSNMQELTDSIKRTHLRITGIEEREEGQAKGICNVINKIITENFPSLEKVMPILIQEASRT
jgi:septal ring factor EnvC (AmiA/AmiB activator)